VSAGASKRGCSIPHAIFELETFDRLPLWAQVLLASRMVRRAVLALPADVTVSQRDRWLAGLDAIDRSARDGTWSQDDRRAMGVASRMQPVVNGGKVAEAYHWAADATHAAHDSTDFAAAETACTAGVRNAIAHASESPGMSPLQARIFMAGDLDLLRFACEESRIGRYDGLGTAVLSRLTPVHPPT